MRLKHKVLAFLVSVLAAAFCISSCTDEIKFGNDFLEKAPGGTVTADTVFSNAEYTRQFLAAIYSTQYYALPTNSTNAPPQCRNYWKGMTDALSDVIQFYFSNTIVNNKYYTGALTAQSDSNGNYNIYPFTNEYIWENVRNCYILLERIDEVPDLSDSERARMKDEAKCLLASTYFTAFRYYGGLPLVQGTFSGSEDGYDLPRGSVEETVNFMVGLCDEVIKANNLPFTYLGTTDQASETGRWTIAGAMALKVKILQHAASPLFNDTKPYYDGSYTMDDPSPVWYGNYDQSRWTKVKTACEELLNKIAANGAHHMVVPTGTTQEEYRYAYRASYLLEDSPEVLMSVRVSKNANGNDYGWFNLRTNSRFSYCPTEEYVEMFPWADGTPFNWEETEAAGELDHIFIKGERVAGKQMLQNRVYTRDPRLYENVAVNGALQTINWSNGVTSGANYETWVGGTTAQQKAIAQTDHYGTGYRYLKYYAGEAIKGTKPQWVLLSLSDVYLTYAEALAWTGDLSKAIDQVDIVRARTGLKGLAACNPTLNLTSDKDALINEILRERACEGLFNDTRYFDLIRYKRAEDFEKVLHRLLIYRMVKQDDGTYVREESQWYNSDRTKAAQDTERWYEPDHFEYERVPVTNLTRIWWTQGFDPKWYLQPFPDTEINKGYGLVQNVGW